MFLGQKHDGFFFQDYFLPGNGHALKIVHSNEERCFLEFYPDSRADGLHTREHLQGKKTIEIFMNRSDRLIYRSIAFRPEARTSSSGNPFEIQKVTEKFSRDHSIDCDDDVAKRVFYLSDNRIRLDYHYGDERIARSSIIFYKNGTNSITQVDVFIFKEEFMVPGESVEAQIDAFGRARNV